MNLTDPFWAALEQGELRMQWCPACERWQWTPMPACSSCLGEGLDWRPVDGGGTLYSWSVVQRPQSEAFEAPYVVAIVELNEGPRLLTTLVDVSTEALAVGLLVRVVPRPGPGGRMVYPFTTVARGR